MKLLTADDVRRSLNERVKKHGDQKALAAQLGISEGHLSALLSGNKEPGPLVLDPLNLERVVLFRAKPAPGNPNQSAKD